MPIIFKHPYDRPESVWINSSDGITVFFSYNYFAEHISAYINTPCGVSQHTYFGDFNSVEDGLKAIAELNESDADRIVKEILAWDSNKSLDLSYFQEGCYPNDHFKREFTEDEIALIRYMEKREPVNSVDIEEEFGPKGKETLASLQKKEVIIFKGYGPKRQFMLFKMILSQNQY